VQRLIDSATSVNGYSITTGNYIYKDQPTCQNGRAVKVIWSRPGQQLTFNTFDWPCVSLRAYHDNLRID